jgi:nicotinamide mononucleotide transporter
MNDTSSQSILEQIVGGALSASMAEQFATVLGVVGVWLMIKRKIAAFPIGLVQVSIFAWVCFHAGLYSETALQVMFFCGLAYGWWHWTRGAARARGAGGAEERTQATELPVTLLPGRERVAWIAAALALWAAWGGIMVLVGARAAWVDAFVFAIGVTSQVLQARKVLENWPGWLISNCVAVGLFWSQGFYWFAALYLVFAFMAVAGWREWTVAMRAQTRPVRDAEAVPRLAEARE